MLYLAALLFLAACIIPWIPASDWWIRAFDFPRPQIAAGGVVLLLLCWRFWRFDTPWQWLLLGLVAVGLAFQLFRILPYTPLYPRQSQNARDPAPEHMLSMVITNVLMDNRNSRGLLEIIEKWDPDLVLAVETDERWVRELDVLEKDRPHRVAQSQDNTYGMVLYSRFELVRPEVRFLVDEDVPSIRTRVRLGDGRLVWLYGIHPEPPSPTEAPDSVDRDAELVLVAREVAERKEPVIVTGDLNDVAWSHTTRLMQRLSGLLDPRRGRGMYNTFHAKIPFLRWPLDHVFYSTDFRLVHLERLPAYGSDHFPVYFQISLEPGAAAAQEEPQPEGDDQEEADEKIEEAREESEPD